MHAACVDWRRFVDLSLDYMELSLPQNHVLTSSQDHLPPVAPPCPAVQVTEHKLPPPGTDAFGRLVTLTQRFYHLENVLDGILSGRRDGKVRMAEDVMRGS